jgi:hypothetical protein
MRRFNLRQAVSITAGLCLALFVLAHGVASADDAKCVITANKNAAKVAKAQGKDIVKCLKDAGGGKLTGTIENCLTSDPKGKVDKASRKLSQKVGSACADSVLPVVPPVEVDDPDGLSEIMIDKELAVIHAIFGTDLDATGLIVKKVDDKLGWKCQSAVAKAAGKCQDAKLATFNSCKKAELKRGLASAQALQDACMGTNGPPNHGIPDTKGKIAKKCGNGLGGTLGKKCALGAPALDTLFPPCAGVVLADCLDQKIECEVCLALNELDGLDRNCDEFDNGVADGSCGEAEPTEPDLDGDDWNNDVESCLDSDPTDPNSSPESAAIPETCNDHLDNDRDGATDQDDSGCNLPGPSFGTFPPAGSDVFESSMVLTGYRLAIPGFGICPVDFDSHGPTCVDRSNAVDRGDGRREIDTEIVAMQLRGTATILPDPNCELPSGPVEVNIYEDPDQTSGGQVTASTPGIDFPAESFFDVFFQIEVELPDPIGEITIAGGPPGGPAGAPVRVNNSGINGLPPHHTPGNTCVNPNCYDVGGPHLHCPVPPLDHYKVYNVDDVDAFVPVTLRDQFINDPNVVLDAVDKFANPVQKTVGEGLFERVYEIADPFTHLVWYHFTASATARSVDIHNQFGHQTLVVRDPTHLLVAAVKNEECADVRQRFHFKCYDATGPDPNQIVKLDDQFHHDPNSEIVDVGKPVKFCTPVDKNDEGIENERDHLTCYRIDPQIPLNLDIDFRDQWFGPFPLVVQENEYLCVPTHKHDWRELECGETFPPECGGACPPGEECVDIGGICECEPIVPPVPCDFSPFPICDGFCTEVDDICANFGGICQCVAKCEFFTPPACGGGCPFPTVCVDIGGGLCGCG